MKTQHIKIFYSIVWVLTIGSFILNYWESKNGIFFAVAICSLLYGFSKLILFHKNEYLTFDNLKIYIITEKTIVVGSILLASFFFYAALTE